MNVHPIRQYVILPQKISRVQFFKQNVVGGYESKICWKCIHFRATMMITTASKRLRETRGAMKCALGDKGCLLGG